MNMFYLIVTFYKAREEQNKEETREEPHTDEIPRQITHGYASSHKAVYLQPLSPTWDTPVKDKKE